jgi:hypothetical protein
MPITKEWLLETFEGATVETVGGMFDTFGERVTLNIHHTLKLCVDVFDGWSMVILTQSKDFVSIPHVRTCEHFLALYNTLKV